MPSSLVALPLSAFHLSLCVVVGPLHCPLRRRRISGLVSFAGRDGVVGRAAREDGRRRLRGRRRSALVCSRLPSCVDCAPLCRRSVCCVVVAIVVLLEVVASRLVVWSGLCLPSYCGSGFCLAPLLLVSVPSSLTCSLLFLLPSPILSLSSGRPSSSPPLLLEGRLPCLLKVSEVAWHPRARNGVTS